jgi:hypothetical protein
MWCSMLETTLQQGQSSENTHSHFTFAVTISLNRLIIKLFPLALKRCTKNLPCGHRCPSLCGEECPSLGYCQECCDDDKKSAVVDHIEMAEYGDHDVNKDPVVVLPCGHFFSTSTLDGHFGMSEVYVRTGIDSLEYVALNPLAHANISEKPRSCPQCRKVVHSINRYGRIFRLSELRSLERKHAISVDQLLSKWRHQLEENGKDHAYLRKRLEKAKKRIEQGPMMRVYEACPPETRDLCEVPKPPLTQLIRCIELLGRVYSVGAEKKDDELYTKAKEAFMEAMELADSSSSLHAGARVRLHLVATLTKFQDATDSARKEALDHLNWIINQKQKLADLANEAIEIKRALVDRTSEISQVMKAIANAEAGGYNYGTSWSDHWYQCPNGHPYFIGDCGGAMVRSICPECGEAVGGTHHQLDSSNSRVQGQFASILGRIPT